MGGGLSAIALAEAERGMAEMSKVYDEAEGAQASDANERSEDKPGASYIWGLGTGSMIENEAAIIKIASL